jgi:predicted amidohydrolase YtcJ
MIDKILFNGNIVTLTKKASPVSALAIARETIVAYGTDAEILPLATSRTVKENLERRTVIPGLTDAHLHWLWTARAMRYVDVFEVPTKTVALARVAERVKDTAPGEWVIGHGWSQSVWSDKAFPTAADLDTVAPNHPVCLHAKSGHAVWVNSTAMRVAGIPANVTNEGIQHDGSGQPTGIFFETAAELITAHIPDPNLEQIAELMQDAQQLALASGLTGCHDFDGPNCLRVLQMLRERDQLSLRFVKNINDSWVDHAYEIGLRWGFGDDWLRIGGVKMFADGALGPLTALMLDPYETDPKNTGMAVLSKEEMREQVSKASIAGLPSTIHAIGDQAVRTVLDVYADIRKEEAARGITPDQRRHRIEHVQNVHPDDAHRLAALDIIASMQPIHATSDMDMAERYWGDRCERAYNARLQIDQGAVVAFGSDSPVDPFDPFAGIYAAVTRRRPDGSPGENGWYPELRLTVEEALRGFTIGPAYAAGMEDRLGKLAPGYLADLVVLDRDLMSIPPDEILDMASHVVATMVGGQWRFGGI